MLKILSFSCIKEDCLDIVFPDLENFFKDNLHLKTSYALLEKHSSANDISSTRIDGLTNLLYNSSRGKYNYDDTLRLKSLARNSVGLDNSPIVSIPGIGYILGAMIISEIDDIKKFSNPSKLLAFAGLDPVIKQSGNFQSDSMKVCNKLVRVIFKILTDNTPFNLG